jgi:hypothetical protein
LDSPDFAALYDAFLYSEQQRAKDEVELHHQLRWIGSMLAYLGNHYIAWNAKDNPRIDVASMFAPDHWGMEAPKPKRRETLKERAEKLRAEGVPVFKMGKS